MTDDMNERSLSTLYRRLCATQVRPAASGEAPAELAAQLASAPQGAAIADLLRALEPAAQTLASDVSQLQRAHLRHDRGARRVGAAGRHHHATRLRWAGGLAASLALALGLLLSVPLGHAPAPWEGIDAGVATVTAVDARGDVIFAASGEAPHKAVHPHAQAQGDQLFRADFSMGG